VLNVPFSLTALEEINEVLYFGSKVHQMSPTYHASKVKKAFAIGAIRTDSHKFLK
jgi:hypothetical protein